MSRNIREAIRELRRGQFSEGRGSAYLYNEIAHDETAFALKMAAGDIGPYQVAHCLLRAAKNGSAVTISAADAKRLAILIRWAEAAITKISLIEASTVGRYE